MKLIILIHSRHNINCWRKLITPLEDIKNHHRQLRCLQLKLVRLRLQLAKLSVPILDATQWSSGIHVWISLRYILDAIHQDRVQSR